MEWAWLKDWWRLKSLRRRHRQFPIDGTNCSASGVTHADNTDNGHTDNNNTHDDDDDDAHDICFCDDCMNVIRCGMALWDAPHSFFFCNTLRCLILFR